MAMTLGAVHLVGNRGALAEIASSLTGGFLPRSRSPWDTVRTMHGTPAFGTERQLQAVLADHASLLGAEGVEVRVRREMPMGSVIPDLVLVSFDRVPARSILRLRWSYSHAFVVAELRRVALLRRETLAARMFDRQERVNRFLDELIDAGALEAVSDRSVRLSPELRSLRARVVAVEAKLSRWTEALEQAVSYRRFSDRSYVAMDAGRVDAECSDLSNAFRRAGIGLLLLDGANARRVHAAREDQRPTAGKEYVRFSSLGARSQTLWSRR